MNIVFFLLILLIFIMQTTCRSAKLSRLRGDGVDADVFALHRRKSESGQLQRS